MAYLEGESLEDRIAKGPLPLKDALDIARQVAEGLEAAHEKGIVLQIESPASASSLSTAERTSASRPRTK